MHAALQALVERHDALRTTLHRRGVDVVQHVSTGGEVPLTEESFTGTSSELQNTILSFLDEPFQVHGGALVRARLLRRGTQANVLMLSVHHAVCDGWSAGLLQRDFVALYQAEAQQVEAALPALELQFPDYATWEWQLACEEPPGFWRQWLASGHPRMRLGGTEAAEGRPGVFRSIPLPAIPAETAKDMDSLAAEWRTTPANIVTAAVGSSLVPVFGKRLTIGVFAGNREQPELLDVVGDLADRIPIPIDATDTPTFGELVKRVSGCLAHARDNYTPMAALAPLIRANPERSAGPLLDVTVNYLPHRTRLHGRDTAGHLECGLVAEIDPALELRSFRADRWGDGFGLLDFQHRPQADGGIGGYLLYNSAVVPEESARELAATTNAAIARFVAEPALRVSELATSF
ncbi:condensation domain-containing protein [Amycolatopsis thermoflava]|uniref:Condensation domain-containing protein n=1 Tax=Amycolatopsis thermoflava TaxID=84480 RepID=A0A3N2H4W4_9PSEU|nr:condensation domain-containing protein [Amycolatopsis thermoflava]